MKDEIIMKLTFREKVKLLTETDKCYLDDCIDRIIKEKRKKQILHSNQAE